MKGITVILLMILLSSCGTSKKYNNVPTNDVLKKPSYIQPDTCLTDKQFKMYLNFVKDSMRIENKKTKIEYRYIKDTVRIIKKAEIVQIKEENKTTRKEIKEESKVKSDSIYQNQKTIRKVTTQKEKTERSKKSVWFIAGFVSCLFLVILILILYIIARRRLI